MSEETYPVPSRAMRGARSSMPAQAEKGRTAWVRWMIVLGLFAGSAAAAFAQEESETRDRSWEGRRERRIAPFRRDAEAVMKLVEPLMTSLHDATVEVLSEGRPAALGIVIDARGLVLTKASQVPGTSELAVRFSDGRRYNSIRVAERRTNDLVLLQMEGAERMSFATVAFSDQDPPSVGSLLISAGPDGKPIGLGTVGVPPRPVEEFGVLGINLEDGPTGPIVAVVLPDSGAAEAGIQDGDIVESLDGTSYRTAEGLRKALGALYPGDRVKLSIRRGDERLDLTAELRDRWQLLIGDRAELMVNGPTNGRASGFEQAIQHDTVLEPNRCGGPIVDIEGHVVALNIARAGRVATYAIPAEIVQRDINSMLEELAQAETIATPDAETTPVSAVQGGE